MKKAVVIVRYYIHPLSGETYVTEFVPGITEEEKRTDSDRNLSAEADPNPARKTRERVLTKPL